MTGNLRVFVIDDDYISNIVTENILQRADLPGSIHTYQNPLEALQYFKEAGQEEGNQQFRNLILLDVLMPLMDGDEFVAELEKIHPVADTSVVLLTGSDYPYHTKKFEQFPSVKASLLKPLTEEAIEMLLRKLYGSSPG